MKQLKDFITEKQNFLIKNKNVLKDYDHYEYHPKTKDELQDIIIELLKQGITNLNCIDVSNITDMESLFDDINIDICIGEIDISEWDVSNVIDMSFIFYNCTEFNADLSTWNVSNVENMNCMFHGCENFNSDLSNWDVSKVETMTEMFTKCKEFNSDLTKWDVSNIIDMYCMFLNCDTLEKNNKIPEWYSN